MECRKASLRRRHELTLWDKEELGSLKSGRLRIPGRGTVNAKALRQERAQGAGERWEGAV